MDGTPDTQLHELVMELVRVVGLLQPEQLHPGYPVSLSQGFALHELATSEVPLSQRDLGARLGLEKSTVSRLAAQLEDKRLLVREREPGNRRYYRLRLTPEGRALHDRLGAAMHEQFLRAVSAMDPTDCDALLRGLAALVRVMRPRPAT